MSERILVTYSYIGGTGSNYHLALHYITPTGHHVLQGGPDIPGMELLDLINEEIYSDSNTDSPWGRIIIRSDDLLLGNDIYDGVPAVEVVEGIDLSDIWNLMQQAVDLIEAVGYEYRPLSQNSNTLVRSLLETVGLNLPNPEGYPIPGAHNTLQDPLNPPANACLAPPWPSTGSPMTAPPISPLVLDLDGDGIELTNIEGSNVYFDLDADGFAERTGWITGGDGTLAYDANGNGRIDDINELFGNATTDGFTLLRPFDSNNDGIISASDDQFDELRVWVDSNANGTTDDGELRSLADHQIASIQVNAQAVNQTIEGNSISHVASYQREDGSTAEIVDVWYANDQMASYKIIPDGFVFDPEALKLPDLKGWGDVADLQYAMTLDTDLRVAVKDLVLNGAQHDPASFRAAFEAVLAEWTGTADIEPDSRGAYMDAQHLAVLEAFYGFQYRQLAGTNAGTPDPGPNAAVELEALYQDAVSCMFTHFASQLAVSSRNFGATIDDLLEMPWLALGALHYNKETDRVTGALDTVAALASMLAPDDYAGKIRMIASLIPYLEGVRLDLYGGDQASYSAAFDAAFAAFGDQRLISISCDIAAGTRQLVQGTVGDDVLSAQAGYGAVFIGSGGNDAINGANGNDTYVYDRGDGADTITEAANAGIDDRLVLGDINPSDVTLVRNGNDVTIVIAESAAGAGDGGSVLLKNNLDDYYYQGVDKIVFADGTTWTRPQLRDMLLTSTTANETFNGFAGSDTFRYARGDGNDTIIEASNSGSSDQLLFSDINPSDVTLVRNGNDVTIVIAESAAGAGDGGSVLLKNNLDDYYYQGVEKITFADGTTWTRETLRLALLAQATTSGNDTITGFNVADVITAGAGNDTITAGAGNDTITGGLGNDVITGGADSDTYYYARGDGADTITEAANAGIDDRLILGDINPTDVTLVRNGNDVTIVIAESAAGAGDGGSVLLKNNLDDYYYQGVEKITFANGTTWTRAVLRAMLVNYAGTSGNDTITGSNTADVITAGAGNDTITAGDGNDTITGGLGNDVITGGADSDTYYYARGDGADTITEAANAGIDDRLILGDINPSDVTLVRNGNDVTIVIAESAAGAGDGGSVLLKNNLDDYYYQGVEKITFADGTTWTRETLRLALLAQATTSGNDTITGFNVADVITAGAGNDTITAGAGNDTITGGLGNDVITGGADSDTYYYARGDGADTITEAANAGIDDRLILGDINPTDVTLVRNGNDVTIVIAESAAGAGDGGSVLLKNNLDDYYYQGVEKITFANGTTWTRAVLRAMLVNYAGTSGNDTITGFNVADVITAGAGNDTITAGDGNDTLDGEAGNDILDGGSGDDTHIGGEGDDLLIGNVGADTFDGGNGVDTLDFTYYTANHSINLDTGLVTFSDGTTEQILNIENAIGGAGNNVMQGSSANNRLEGRDGNDALSGGAGNDVLNGGNGTDSHFGGDGDDLLIGNVGADTFDGGNGVDTLDFTYYTANHIIDLAANRVIFSDGTFEEALNIENAIAGSGNNELRGSSANNRLDGGSGNDMLTGGQGSDTFVFAANFGKDTISDFQVGAASDDIIDLKSNVFADFASVLAAATQVGTDTLITYDANNSILLKNVALANLHQDDFRFTAAT